MGNSSLFTNLKKREEAVCMRLREELASLQFRGTEGSRNPHGGDKYRDPENTRKHINLRILYFYLFS